MARRRGHKQRNGRAVGSSADHQAPAGSSEEPSPSDSELTPQEEPIRRWEFEEGVEIAPGRHVLTLLGTGSDYEAYLAWDAELHSTVVVKILRPHLVRNRNELDHLRREAQILSKLSHPIIVRSFGAVTSGPRPHLVLEHLEGPRLSTLIRKYGTLPLEQLLPLCLRICSALHYLQTRHIVHLDVKPPNIVMAAEPRLIDFSIARSWKQAAQLTSDVGTRKYMSPEQCMPGKRGIVGAPADIFGLGVTLYRAISGDVPFPPDDSTEEDSDIFRTYPQLTEEPIPLPDEIPVQVREPVMACLVADPSKRPTAAELAAAFEPLVSMLPKSRPLGRRRPRI